jgi:hypothetical protein
MEILTHNGRLQHELRRCVVAPLPFLVAGRVDIRVGHILHQNVVPLLLVHPVSIRAAAPHTTDLHVHGTVTICGGGRLEAAEILAVQDIVVVLAVRDLLVNRLDTACVE